VKLQANYYQLPVSVNQSQAILSYHPVLQGIALRMLGSMPDAEDIVQDTFLKWLTIDQNKIKNTKSYLIKAVTNNCINHINSLKRKKDECLESFNSSELVERYREFDFAKFDLDNEVSEALAVVHKKLEPLEKAIFLMREVFDFEYEELQQIFDKKKANCRQIFCRAREKLALKTKKMKVALGKQSQLLESFSATCSSGLPSGFINDLKQEITAKLQRVI